MSKSTDVAAQEEEWAKRKEEKRRKKELRAQEKAEKKEKVETDAEKLRKRKRDPLPEELEIDVALPEPVSKKELRKAKKAKTKPSDDADADADDSTEKGDKKPKSDHNDGDKKKDDAAGAKRSEFGVWIGNLPWSATRDSLREFITANTEITNEQITRVNMPAPTRPPNPNWTTKPLNKGFAYVDFADQLSMYAAIALTETKMDGRPLLIKNATSFEGRPEKAKAEEFFGGDAKDGKTAAGAAGAGGKAGNPPNKRVFVGNLSFDITKEDLTEHYSQCGEIADLHMATFEDSGKCKGYAWVTFETVEAATSAVKGFIFKQPKYDDESDEDDKSSDDDEPMKDASDASDSDSDAPKKQKKAKKAKKEKKKPKPQKWYVNRLQGRDLRCEFAEDSTTRYNKRYGKEKKPVEGMDGLHPDRLNRLGDDDHPGDRRRAPRQYGGDKKFGGDKRFGGDREDRAEREKDKRDKHFADKQGQMGERKPRKKVDPRTIKSGAAHTAAPRAPQGIVPAEGVKITFD